VITNAQCRSLFGPTYTAEIGTECCNPASQFMPRRCRAASGATMTRPRQTTSPVAPVTRSIFGDIIRTGADWIIANPDVIPGDWDTDIARPFGTPPPRLSTVAPRWRMRPGVLPKRPRELRPDSVHRGHLPPCG